MYAQQASDGVQHNGSMPRFVFDKEGICVTGSAHFMLYVQSAIRRVETFFRAESMSECFLFNLKKCSATNVCPKNWPKDSSLYGSAVDKHAQIVSAVRIHVSEMCTGKKSGGTDTIYPTEA